MYKIEQIEVYSITRVLTCLRKTYSKQRKREDVQKRENTIEELKAAKKWPEGGFKELADTVFKDVQQMQQMCDAGQLDLHTKKCIPELISASFYTGTSICI
jgi:hypothetical protein